MKKMIFTLVAMITMTVSSMAAVNNNIEKAEIFAFKPAIEDVTRYLRLNENQKAEYVSIQQYFNDQLVHAGRIKGNRRAVKTDLAVKENLKLMSEILSSDQYRKYVTTLNLTLENHGIRKYVK